MARSPPRTRLGACASKWGPMAASRRFPLSHGDARGFVEVQDEGSQIAALLTGADASQQVLDLVRGRRRARRWRSLR